MNIIPIKHLIYTQNFVCVFRNYRHFNKFTKLLICCWILIELIFGVFEVATGVVINNVKQLDSQRIYVLSVTSFSMFLLILALYHSKKFDILMRNFGMYHTIFGDNIYSENLLKEQKYLIVISALLGGSNIGTFIYFTIEHWRYSDDIIMFITGSLKIYHLTVWLFRFIFEHFIVYCILFLISEQLDTIKRAIDTELSVLNNSKITKDEKDVIISVRENRMKKLDSWMTAYKNIKHSSKLYNQIFHAELTVMMLVVFIYLLIVAYLFMTAVMKERQTTELVNKIYLIFLLFSSLCAVARGGQRVHNCLINLRQKLYELYLHSTEDDKYRQQVKDMLRCCSQSMPVRMMTSLNINMSIIPACIACVVSNTVTMLQFNNVI